MLDKNTLDVLKGAGVEMLASFSAPGGGVTVSISKDNAQAFICDPDEFAARHFQVSKADYLDWLAHDGAPLCAAKTRRGSLCKIQIGRVQQGVHDWLAAHRSQYCSFHE